MTIVKDRVAVEPLLPRTCIVNVELVALVGIPDISPVNAFRARPLGSALIMMLHEYGVAPPVACTVCEYGTDTSPPRSEVVVIVGGVSSFVMVHVLVSPTAIVPRRSHSRKTKKRLAIKKSMLAARAAKNNRR